MPKLKIEDLKKIKEKQSATIKLREGGPYRHKIIVHMGTCGIAAGARKILETLLAEMEKHKSKDIMITTSGCAGLCSREPMITVESPEKAPVKYGDLTDAKIKKIFKDHLIDGKIVNDYALAIGHETVG